ncbi:hypothetical protein ACFL3P_01845 [Pseudomonadota bacterium]
MGEVAATNFAGSKIEWLQASLKGELQDAIHYLMEEMSKSSPLTPRSNSIFILV